MQRTQDSPSQTSILERVVKIESELQYMVERSRNLEELHKQAAKSAADMDLKLGKIVLELERNKGFIGGILFMVSAIWIFIKAGIPYLLKVFGKQ